MNGSANCNVKNGAAPLGSERKLAASAQDIAYDFGQGNQRRRRRGPRSDLSIARRHAKCRDCPPADVASGESEAVASVVEICNAQPFTIYCINIRCLFAHFAELCFYLEIHKPHVVMLQET